MRIIGIDPGTTIVGFGIMEISGKTCKLLDYGCIKTKPNAPLETKLTEIKMDLAKIIKLWKPKKAAIERLFFSKNIKTAISVAHARGVILELLNENGLEIKEYTPQQIKMNVCGYGKAKKENIQKMIQIIFGMKRPPKSDDAADAIAAAFSLATSIEPIKC